MIHPTSFQHPGTELSLWPAFGLGLAIAVGNGFARFAYALLLPAMHEDLGWNYALAGWLNTANALGYVIGAVSGYVLLRRYRPSLLFSCGLWLTFLTLLVTGLRSDFGWLTTLRALSGIGAAWVFGCGGALVAIRYQSNATQRSTATGLFFAGAGIGIVLASICINPVLAYMGVSAWPYAWMLLGLLAAIASIWPLYLAHYTGGDANTASSEPLVLRGLIPPLLSYFVFAAGYIVYMTFIFAWTQDQGLSWQFGTVIWIALGIGVSISPFVWRKALDQWNPTTTLAASCVATMLGSAIPLVNAGFIYVLFSSFLFGLGVFIAPASIAVLIQQHMPASQLAKGMTFFTVVFAIGQTIGPVVGGWIGDLGTLDNTLLFGSLLLLIAASVPMVFSRRTIS